jgi:hypothetical protein
VSYGNTYNCSSYRLLLEAALLTLFPFAFIVAARIAFLRLLAAGIAFLGPLVFHLCGKGWRGEDRSGEEDLEKFHSTYRKRM